jgi:hypothetical protein|tara:strand:- start:10722 stop:10982 length:261 start_codon:yes stop_codon:yes gene_type:complete
MVEPLIIILSIVLGFIILSSIIKSNRRRKERELISTVTSLSRGTPSEKFLILQLLKSGIPSVTIFHDLINKKKDIFTLGVINTLIL